MEIFLAQLNFLSSILLIKKIVKFEYFFNHNRKKIENLALQRRIEMAEKGL